MMRLTKVVAITGLLFGSITAAHAVPTWTDTKDFNPDRYVGWFGSSSWTHDITDDGFDVGVDTIDSFKLSVNLYDDQDGWLEVIGEFFLGEEQALIDVPGIAGDRYTFISSGTEHGGWSFIGWLQLSLTGQYTVTITSQLGDFYWGSSTLEVWGNEGGHDVPEPGTLGLMGLGLLAGGIAARRRKKA